MRKLWPGLVLMLVAAAATHFLVLKSIPSFVMSKARTAFQDRGMPVNYWVGSSRITTQTQTVVRPSPDLAYVVCLFDVSDGPVSISAPAWDAYGSLSIFDGQTNNVYVTSLKASDAAPTGVIVAKNRYSEPGGNANGVPIVMIKGEGLALVRRLAPTADAYASASELIAPAKCEKFGE